MGLWAPDQLQIGNAPSWDIKSTTGKWVGRSRWMGPASGKETGELKRWSRHQVFLFWLLRFHLSFCGSGHLLASRLFYKTVGSSVVQWEGQWLCVKSWIPLSAGLWLQASHSHISEPSFLSCENGKSSFCLL